MRIDGSGLPVRFNRENSKSERRADKPSEHHDSIDLRKTVEPENPVYSIEIRRSDDEGKKLPIDILSELRHRSTDGYYDKDEIRRRTSEKIIDSAEFSDVVSDFYNSRVSNDAAKYSLNNEEKIAEMRKKAATGFYDDPANFGAFADKLIKYFGL